MTVNEDLLHTFERTKNPVYRIEEPSDTSIVLGAGRRDKGDLIVRNVTTDRIPVQIRKGGGGTVVLSPGMIVLALVTTVASLYDNRAYAHAINDWFRQALLKIGIPGIKAKGISDLAIGERKILGVSLFRKRHILFYQASLLVKNDLSYFSRYLAYPSRVPDYRRERSHEEFCTTLWQEGYRAEINDIRWALEGIVKDNLSRIDQTIGTAY